MRNDDGVFMFKFASKEGLDQVLQRGLWMIRKSPIILTKWSSGLSLKKGEVTSVPVWVKLHGVPILAYSEDGLSLIATQIGKPLLLDAFTSSMCVKSWSQINFARSLIEVSSESELKSKVTMAILNEEGDGYTKEVIRVEYEWKPPHCGDCKIFGHDLLQCPKHVKETVINDPSKVGTSTTTVTSSDRFTDLTRKKNKDFKSDDEVDEVIFPEGNKWDDEFDIRLKGQARK
ncbi:reverse transcriptase domain-containing protein [Tanacetum coccineum]